MRDQPLGVDFIDINMLRAFEKAGIDLDRRHDADDGGAGHQEPRRDQGVPDRRRRSATSLHYEFTQLHQARDDRERGRRVRLRRSSTRSRGWRTSRTSSSRSGPNAWPNWRNFSDRIIRPGELVIIDLAALTWNGFKSCCYRTYCVGGKPTAEHQRTYDEAHTWLWDSIEAAKPGVTTARHRVEVAVGEGGLGLRGGGPGRRQPLGPRPGPGAVRPAGDLADLVAGPSRRDQAGHDVRARDPARQAPRPRRAPRGDAGTSTTPASRWSRPSSRTRSWSLTRGLLDLAGRPLRRSPGQRGEGRGGRTARCAPACPCCRGRSSRSAPARRRRPAGPRRWSAAAAAGPAWRRWPRPSRTRSARRWTSTSARRAPRWSCAPPARTRATRPGRVRSPASTGSARQRSTRPSAACGRPPFGVDALRRAEATGVAPGEAHLAVLVQRRAPA